MSPRFTSTAVVFLLLVTCTLLLAADASDLIRQAKQALVAGDGKKAVALADEAVKAEPEEPDWVNERGMIHFKLAHIKESIADFDKAIALRPDIEPLHWQRGISYYYAGEYEKGAKQFELHKTVNPDDVENAVWHFLCVAKWKSLADAQKQFMTITGDGREPLMKVHALFAGKAKPQDVMTAANAGKPSKEDLRERLFYAHLYLGLYYEAHGDAAKSAEHIKLAGDKYSVDMYMCDVAKVHQKLRTKP